MPADTQAIRLSFLVAFLAPLLIAAFLIIPLALPHSAYAQASSTLSLSDTIRAAILKDPRSADLSSAQLDALVSALSNQAQAQGMTPQAIAYHPGAFVGTPSTAASYGSCNEISAWLCPLGIALGYGTPDKEVPIGLWITSGLLIVIIWQLRKHEAIAAASRSVPPVSSGPLG
jgi:hypothetical protein